MVLLVVVPRPVDGDLVQSGLHCRELFRGEGDLVRSQVLLEPVEFGGARNGDDPGFLRHQPGQGELGRGAALLCGVLPDQGDDGLVGPQSLRAAEPGHGGPHVAGGELGVLGQGPGQVPSPQGRKADQPDPQLL